MACEFGGPISKGNVNLCVSIRIINSFFVLIRPIKTKPWTLLDMEFRCPSTRFEVLKLLITTAYFTCFIFQVADQVIKYAQGRTIVSYYAERTSSTGYMPSVSTCPGIKGDFLQDLSFTDSDMMFFDYYPWPEGMIWHVWSMKVLHFGYSCRKYFEWKYQDILERHVLPVWGCVRNS